MVFQAGQRVRLTATYLGRRLSHVAHAGVTDPKPIQVLHAGTVFTVARMPTGNARGRLDGPTVILRNDEGTWCIPERLLEAVEAVEQPQPTESGRDAEGGRVG
jgi:hypothetical protein